MDEGVDSDAVNTGCLRMFVGGVEGEELRDGGCGGGLGLGLFHEYPVRRV